MRRALANLRIGRKLMLVLASGLVPGVCVAGLAIWGLTAIRSAVDREQAGVDQVVVAQEAAADMGRVTSIVGHIALGSKCETCHDNASGGDRDHQNKVVQEYRSLLSNLKAAESDDEGRRLVGELENAGARWYEINSHVLELSREGKRQEAIEAYRSQSIPGHATVDKARRDYLQWQQPRTAEMRTRTASYMTRTSTAVMLLSLLALGLGSFVGVAVTRSIAKPLGLAVRQLDQIAGGDISHDLSSEDLDRRDEIGLLSQSMRTMSTSLRELLKDVANGIHVVSSSSAELSNGSGRMSEGSQQASNKAHAVAVATEQMAANIMSVSAGVEQTTTNLASVASATEQMTATIGEIAGNSEKARRITEEATRQAVCISEQMNGLGRAAQEIGKVTETINEISSQTNLLALNATIEAARAGSAGKGFAVVANEIKELAQQTAAATEDIKTRIASVQSSTAAGIAEIERVSGVIHEVSDIVSSIAASIEEQATVTRDIARNIGEAATGVRDANVRMSEGSQATQEIAKEISAVDQATREMAEGGEQVRASATNLSKLAEQLQTTVSRFHVERVGQ